MNINELYLLKGQLTTHIEVATAELKKVNEQLSVILTELSKNQTNEQKEYKGPELVKQDQSS